MAHELRASIVVRLAPDLLAEAEQVQAITAAWNTFLGGVISTHGDISIAPSLTIGEAKSEPVRRPRRSRARLAAVPDSAA